MSFLSRYRDALQKRKIDNIKRRQKARTERQLVRTESRMERKLAKRKLRKTYDGKFQDLETGEQFTETQVQEMGGDVVDQAGKVVKSYEGQDDTQRLTDDGVSPTVKIVLISVGVIALVGGTILVVKALNKNK